jgi:hypothetical protein
MQTLLFKINLDSILILKSQIFVFKFVEFTERLSP